MKDKRSIALPDRESGHCFRAIASFSAPILCGEDVGLKGAQQGNGLELPEFFASIFNCNAEAFFRIQKQVGQVRVDFSPGSNERIARRWISVETWRARCFPVESFPRYSREGLRINK